MEEKVFFPEVADGAPDRSIDYTRISKKNFRDFLISPETISDMDPEELTEFLIDHASVYSFGDQLKRYIQESIRGSGRLSDLDDDACVEIIQSTFEYNNAPQSFVPTSTRWNVAVRSWLTANRVRRDTVFLLGFGLKMSAETVSRFLTKYLSEDDFRPDDPTETIYRYCFLNELPYSQAVAWKNRYKELSDDTFDRLSGPLSDQDKRFLTRLLTLKNSPPVNNHRLMAEKYFQELYDECRQAILDTYHKTTLYAPTDGSADLSSIESITPAEVEQLLCGGIPFENGNLKRANLSKFYHQFGSYRLSRQRISSILSKKTSPDRYDLITLLFFIFARMDMPDNAELERVHLFEERANAVLRECGLGEIYLLNPYDAFIEICLLSEEPHSIYGDMWDNAYGESEMV